MWSIRAVWRRYKRPSGWPEAIRSIGNAYDRTDFTRWRITQRNPLSVLKVHHNRVHRQRRNCAFAHLYYTTKEGVLQVLEPTNLFPCRLSQVCESYMRRVFGPSAQLKQAVSAEWSYL